MTSDRERRILKFKNTPEVYPVKGGFFAPIDEYGTAFGYTEEAALYARDLARKRNAGLDAIIAATRGASS